MGNWRGVSQEILLGEGDAYTRLVLKQVMLVDCGEELGGSGFPEGETSRINGVEMGWTRNEVGTERKLGEMTSAGYGVRWRDGSTSGILADATVFLGAGQQEARGCLSMVVYIIIYKLGCLTAT